MKKIILLAFASIISFGCNKEAKHNEEQRRQQANDQQRIEQQRDNQDDGERAADEDAAS